MNEISIIDAISKDDVAAVKAVFIDYMAFIEDYLGQSLCFQGTDTEFATFPDIYDALLLVRLNGEAVAACGIKPFKPGICELKRLYCRPEGRGHHVGLRLSQRAISKAKALGYDKMFLDTDAGLTHANKIYEQLGFTDIERYYENPMGCSRYMALDLKGAEHG